MNPEDVSSLRLAPPESAEALARCYQRERLALRRQREAELEGSLEPFRVGSVPYLNAAPLTRGLEEQISYATPAKLAEMLRRDELDAALLSVTEVLLNDRYDILDGVAIASLGEVKSVFLAHRPPLEQVREVYCDGASLASASLLRVLAGERGLPFEYKVLPEQAAAANFDAVLLIGDPALDFAQAPHDHQIWDLGAAWYELTGLPFVYAVWALRRGVPNQALCARLREAYAFGRETLDDIIRDRTEYDYDFRRDYLGWHVHFYLGSDERRGLARFAELLEKHRLGPVYAPRFVAG